MLDERNEHARRTWRRNGGASRPPHWHLAHYRGGGRLARNWDNGHLARCLGLLEDEREARRLNVNVRRARGGVGKLQRDSPHALCVECERLRAFAGPVPRGRRKPRTVRRRERDRRRLGEVALPARERRRVRSRPLRRARSRRLSS